LPYLHKLLKSDKRNEDYILVFSKSKTLAWRDADEFFNNTLRLGEKINDLEIQCVFEMILYLLYLSFDEGVFEYDHAMMVPNRIKGKIVYQKEMSQYLSSHILEKLIENRYISKILENNPFLRQYVFTFFCEFLQKKNSERTRQIRNLLNKQCPVIYADIPELLSTNQVEKINNIKKSEQFQHGSLEDLNFAEILDVVRYLNLTDVFEGNEDEIRQSLEKIFQHPSMVYAAVNRAEFPYTEYLNTVETNIYNYFEKIDSIWNDYPDFPNDLGAQFLFKRHKYNECLLAYFAKINLAITNLYDGFIALLKNVMIRTVSILKEKNIQGLQPDKLIDQIKKCCKEPIQWNEIENILIQLSLYMEKISNNQLTRTRSNRKLSRQTF
jgi:hypothetical protein